ncbi:hypothetical protein M407DRAFT_31271, partial [Tulasnella calospora MUT 4182]
MNCIYINIGRVTPAPLEAAESGKTRISAETAASLLGGRALFLGKEDIKLGANESTSDTAKATGSVCQGISARVGEHKEIEERTRHPPVPVLKALFSLWYPTQIINAHLFSGASSSSKATTSESLLALPPLIIAWLLSGTPPNPKYHASSAVWDNIKEVDYEKGIFWTDDPRAAVKGADAVVTDTWY